MTTQERMTATSKANAKAADKAGYTVFDGGGVGVWVELRGNRAYLCGSSSPLAYPDQQAARRAFKRIRPDLEPTTI
jgi:hypothetical protein